MKHKLCVSVMHIYDNQTIFLLKKERKIGQNAAL